MESIAGLGDVAIARPGDVIGHGGGGVLRYFAVRFFSMVSWILAATPGPLRRAMQIKVDIMSSRDAATCHKRGDHQIDGYQSS